MSAKTTIIVAGSLGLIISLGLIGVRRFLRKKAKEYDDYYADFHRLHIYRKSDDSNEGVEFIAVQ